MNPNTAKSEVWIVDLSDGKGHEQKGERPAVVLGKANGLIITVPLTSNVDKARFSYTHLIESTQENGLNADSVALLFQLTALDETRFKHRIGRIQKQQQTAIDELLKQLLKLGE